jgi:cobaltochelatase CobS
LQHKSFADVLSTLSAGVNIALVGPAGSGKTTIVYNAAKVLNLTFASQSVSAQSTVFDFFGYKSATGDYIGTMFREKYENGGVFLLDEFDAGNPNVLAALNQATANGHCPFPDKMIEKHKDFIIVMAGNTFGGGGTIDYVGRNKIDAATLDRFAFIYIDYDEILEKALSSNENWCLRVQDYRRRVIEKKVRTIISPRATFNGEKLLSAGLSMKTVEEMIIFKGLTDDERNLIAL